MRQDLVWAAVVMAATLSMVVPCANAEDITGAPIEESFAAAKGRLNLTPEQEAKLAPVLRANADKTRAIATQYRATPTIDERQAKYRELAEQQHQFREQLAGVLTPEQLMQWDRMRAEALTRAQQERIPDTLTHAPHDDRTPAAPGY